MPTKFNRLFLLPFLCVSLILGSCALDEGEGTTDLNSTYNDEEALKESLDLNYGGLSEADEEEAFGDSVLLEDTEAIQSYEDEMMGESEVQEALDAAEADADKTFEEQSCHSTVYYVAQGQFPFNPDIDQSTDWSGSIETNQGALVVLTTVFYEPKDQVLPRTDRKIIEFKSATLPHHDGLLFRVIWGEGCGFKGDNLTDKPEITVILGDKFTTTLDPTDFYYHQMYVVDELGNQVNIKAAAMHPNPDCRTGLLFGHYDNIEPGLGRFRGLFLGFYGEVSGYMKGFYGKNRFGFNRFFGKIIGRLGGFVGIMHGSYKKTGEGPNGNNLGRFWGRIVETTEEGAKPAGHMRGGYHQRERAMGSFQGFYRMYCGKTIDDPMSTEEFEKGEPHPKG